MRSRSEFIALIVLQLAVCPSSVGAEPTPFANGDQLPEMTATCQDLSYWIERLPNSTHRVDMAVAGPLTAVEFDGALAYLVICPSSGPQVLCVTYSTNGMKVGERVKMAGGMQRAGADKIMLDPCLASRE
jgi:hypothetical protein